MAVNLSERTRAEMAAGERESAKWRNEATLERWKREGLIKVKTVNGHRVVNVKDEAIEFTQWCNPIPDEVIARLTLAIAHHYGPDAVNQNKQQENAQGFIFRKKTV